MKIRTFLQAFTKSISSPIYYVDVLNAPLKFSILFFLTSYVFLSILATFFYIGFDVPGYKHSFEKTMSSLEENFPNDLEVSWNGRLLSSNKNSPIILPYPENAPHQDLPDSFIFISPAIKTSDEIKATNPNSLVVIGQNSLFVSSNGGWSNIALSETPGFERPFSINKSDIHSFSNSWKDSLSKILYGTSFLFPIAFVLGMPLLRLISLFFNSIFVYYLLKFVGKGIPFKKIIQISLHITVVAELVRILTSQVPATQQLDMFGLTYWMYLIVILLSLWNVKTIILMKMSGRN